MACVLLSFTLLFPVSLSTTVRRPRWRWRGRVRGRQQGKGNAGVGANAAALIGVTPLR